jgi:hypothetical protein
METLEDDELAGEQDGLVGCVIRHALEEIRREEPDKAKWLTALLRKRLSRSEFRLVREDWELHARNMEKIDRSLPVVPKSRLMRR